MGPCFQIAAQDKEFWDKELERKAVLFITHPRSKSQLEADGTGVDSSSNSNNNNDDSPRRKRQRVGRGRGNKQGKVSGGGGSQGQQSGGRGKGVGKSQSGKGKTNGKGEAKHPDGRFRADGSGKPICWQWAHKNGCALSVRITEPTAVSSAETLPIALRLVHRSQRDGRLPARRLLSPSLRSPLRIRMQGLLFTMAFCARMVLVRATLAMACSVAKMRLCS